MNMRTRCISTTINYREESNNSNIKSEHFISIEGLCYVSATYKFTNNNNGAVVLKSNKEGWRNQVLLFHLRTNNPVI